MTRLKTDFHYARAFTMRAVTGGDENRLTIDNIHKCMFSLFRKRKSVHLIITSHHFHSSELFRVFLPFCFLEIYTDRLQMTDILCKITAAVVRYRGAPEHLSHLRHLPSPFAARAAKAIFHGLRA